MVRFIIENPRWEVVEKYMDPTIVRHIVEDGLDFGFTISELNGFVEESKTSIEDLIYTYSFNDPKQVCEDLELIHLIIIQHLKEGLGRYSALGSIKKAQEFGNYFNKIGDAIEAIEQYNRTENTINEGFKFMLTLDMPNSRFKSVTIPRYLHNKFWDTLKSYTLSRRGKVKQSIYKKRKPEKVIREILLVGFNKYIMTELKFNQTHSAEFIGYFIEYLKDQTPLWNLSNEDGKVPSKTAEKIINRSNFDK